jgi:adenylylsulfate kinase-like enzyme
VLCAFVSPYRAGRDQVRALVPAGRFFEIAVACGPDERQRRDDNGLYRRGEHYYEPPTAPDYVAATEHEATGATVAALLNLLVDRGIVG